MKDVRKSLLGYLTLCIFIAALAGFIIVFRADRTAAWVCLGLDVLLMGVLHFVVRDSVAPPRATATQITDALRELARGHYHKRLDAESFGDLTEAAHAFNELAGVMSDRLDPHVGVVRYRPKSAPDGADINHSYHPELGSVRPIDHSKEADVTADDEQDSQAEGDALEASQAREEHLEELATNPETGAEDSSVASDDAAAETTEETATAEEAPEDASNETSSQDGAPDETTADSSVSENEAVSEGEDEGESAETDEASDKPDAPAERDAVPETETAADDVSNEEAEAPEEEDPSENEGAESIAPLPSEKEMEELHTRYNAIRLQFELPQVEFNDLVPVLMETAKALLDQHQCRAIRFEVKPQDGDVALLPKLIR